MADEDEEVAAPEDETVTEDLSEPPAKTGLTRLPTQPPRSSGDPKQDLPGILSWLNDFYKTAVLEQYFATTIAEAGDFDPADLPDPANTNLAQAQQTANEAYIIGTTAEAKTSDWLVGTIQVVDPDTTAVYEFEEPQPDDAYQVILTRIAETSPAAGATAIVTVEKTVDDFTVTFASAPGGGDTVDWDFLLCRGPTSDA